MLLKCFTFKTFNFKYMEENKIPQEARKALDVSLQELAKYENKINDLVYELYSISRKLYESKNVLPDFNNIFIFIFRTKY